MKTIFAAAAMSLLAASAMAQDATAPATDGETPAIATPEDQNPTAPVAGENSFTEGQARERLEEAGYSEIGPLALDESGVWRATATRDGASVNVALDYQGNIVAN